jgi:hypothetical protein
VQTQGLLQESGLATLLQTMQTERATGALALESENDTASLFFLFGHLFHAAGPSGQGEDVVLNALTWHDGTFRFDPRAKLPPEETIKSSPAELIAEAERRTPEAPPAGAEEQAGWAGAAYEPAEDYGIGTYSEPGGGYPEPAWTSAVPDFATEQQAAGYSPWNAPAPAPTEESTPAPAAPGTAPVPTSVPTSAPTSAPTLAPTLSAPAPAPARYQPAAQRPAPAPALAPTPAPAYRPEPAVPVGSAPRPEPPPAPAAERGQVGVMGAPAVEPLDIMYPLPAGQVQYEGLKSAFVDFPKLLRTLRGDQHTGYVRLTAPDFSAMLLFHQGHLLDARCSAPGARSGDGAFQAIRRSMDAGTGVLDVIDLASEIVEGIGILLTSPLLYTGLLGRFVNFDALLAYLTEEGVDGAVLVVGSSDVGIIMLSHGHVLGAYTQTNPALSTATTGVGKIATDKAARIEVKSGAGALAAIDVETALSRAY